MNKYAILDEYGTVINVVLWDGISEFNVNGLIEITNIPGVGIGWSYIDDIWISPPQEETPDIL